jgi:hypothetical protein
MSRNSAMRAVHLHVWWHTCVRVKAGSYVVEFRCLRQPRKQTFFELAEATWRAGDIFRGADGIQRGTHYSQL